VTSESANAGCFSLHRQVRQEYEARPAAQRDRHCIGVGDDMGDGANGQIDPRSGALAEHCLPEIDVVAATTTHASTVTGPIQSGRSAGLGGERRKTLLIEPARCRLVGPALGPTEDRLCGTIDNRETLRDRRLSRVLIGLSGERGACFTFDEVNTSSTTISVDVAAGSAPPRTREWERRGCRVASPIAPAFVLDRPGNPEEGDPACSPCSACSVGGCAPLARRRSCGCSVVDQRTRSTPDPRGLQTAHHLAS